MSDAPLTEPAAVEPEKLQPARLNDAQKRKIFFALAAVISVIILANVFGPSPAAPTGKHLVTGPTAQQIGPSPAQLAEFQANLKQTEAQFRALEADREKALTQAQQPPTITATELQNAEALREANGARATYDQANSPDRSAQRQAQAELEQRAYQSLFADNLVRQESVPGTSSPSMRANVPAAIAPVAFTAGELPLSPSTAPAVTARKALDFDPAKQPTYRLPEGTILEAVLTNRLDGELSGPVNAMITTDVYLPGTRLLLIPAGTRVLGEASKVSAFGQQRLAIAFHRLLVPGLAQYSIPLDKLLPGLSQEGETGLHDKVNSHYASIFGASLAIGAIGGLAQIGNSGSTLSYDPGAQFRNGVSASMAQSADRVLDRFLNRLPTITIREGTRIKVLLTDDLPVPAFAAMQGGGN